VSRVASLARLRHLHPVVLTRPAGRNESLASRLQVQGCETLALPALRITPLPSTDEALPLPGDYDLVIFVSGTAVHIYTEQLRQIAALPQWPCGVPVACVGPATASVMCGDFWPDTLRVLHPDAQAPRHDSEALWQVLSQSGLSLRRVLLVRGQTGREWLAQRLAQHGVAVDRYAVYTRQPADWPDSALRVLKRWRDTSLTPVWLITSAEGLEAVAQNLSHAGLKSWWRTHRFVLTHPRLADRLSALMGWGQEAQTNRPLMVKISLPLDDDIERDLLRLCTDFSDDVSRLQSNHD